MAEHVLKTLFQLRYDTYSNWMNSSEIFKPGEILIAAMPAEANAPSPVGIKIGDGRHYFDELLWLQGIAADVYNWAKSSTKPTYTANEISGLAEYVAAHSGGSGGAGASSAYRITYDTTSSKYILEYYDEDTKEWKAAAGDEISLNDILTRITTIERWANGAVNQLGNIELPLTGLIYDEVVSYLNKLDVSDTAVAHSFVTAVEQVNGRIQVSRSILTAADITSGVFETSQGGTGLTRVLEDEVLTGSLDGTITTRTFVTEIAPDSRNSFATVGAIIDYVNEITAGLTGAMHFVGEATVVITNGSRVDPQIRDYYFRYAEPGDVILANNAQEYVWTGMEWRLLGDEGSYAIKGSITNADIAENAAISQEKISNLTDTLDTKVDKVEGKGLSSNDYTTEEKQKLEAIESEAQVNVIEHIYVNDIESTPTTIGGQPKSVNLNIPVLSEENINKLDGIEEHAQENVIEHILVNGTEVTPSTINEQPKSVNIEFTPFTQSEKDKLSEIEAEAQVNKIESITINGTEYVPDNTKNVDITIDQAALDLDVLTGARVPGTTTGSYEDVDVTSVTKQLELARVAKTGYISELVEKTDTYITLYCGNSREVI